MYHLRVGFQFVLFCLSSGLYNPANAAIIIDSIIETEELCDLSNGTITIIATGGSSTLSYSIDGGISYQSSNFFDGLESNDYLIIVSDGTNCTEVQTAQITSATTPRIDLEYDCSQGANLVDIDLIPFDSGVPPFTYQWTGPDGNYSTEDLSLVPPGEYTIILIDRDGCHVDSTFTIPICCALNLNNDIETKVYNCFADFIPVGNLTFDTLNLQDKITNLDKLLGITLSQEPCNDLDISIVTETNSPSDCSEPLIIKQKVEISDGTESVQVTQTNEITHHKLSNLEPSIVCPDDLFITTDENSADRINSWLNSYGTVDNCSELTVINNFQPSMMEAYCPDIAEVKFTATDNCMNAFSCKANIHIGDENILRITCPEQIELGCTSLNPDSLIYRVLDSMTILSENPYEVEHSYSLDIYEIGCDFVYTFDAEVTIYDLCEQEATCSVRVDVGPEAFVYIPNTFSPNLGEVNKLTVYANSVIEEIEVFRIYNRWGQTVYEKYNFQANDESMGWDGNINNEADDMEVFTYYVICMSVTGRELKYAGNLTLLK